jgi:DNA-binding MurR/RpiR family transcriptional regulator
MAGLPFEPAASIADEVEVSEPTVGRFCRAVGYKSFKDL